MSAGAPASADLRRFCLYFYLRTQLWYSPFLSVGSSAYGRRSGNTGSITRPKVELITAANDAYQAAIAVAIPK